MWLDRLAGTQSSSGSSTPQPSSRPIPQHPRRTSSKGNLSPYVTSQRAGLSPRGSTLSLVSNDSTSSLLASARKPNGASSRGPVPAENVTDSVETLEKLLSAGSGDADGTGDFLSEITSADLELDVDFDGATLKEIAAAPLPESSIYQIRRSQTVEEYEKDKTKFQDLHRSITACDDVLKSVETNLASFRNDLAAVSADIESLQDRSTALNKRLENRQGVEKALGPIVEDLSIPPETVSKISEGHIDESWAKILNEVDKRSAAHNKKSGADQIRAAQDLDPLLEKLTSKAIERIRDFLVTQIKALRSPNINAQIIQQHNFLRFKDLFTFLHKHHATLAEEISLAYMNTMRWYYNTQFMRYEKALTKMKLHVLGKNDALGVEDSARKGNVLSSARSVGSHHDAFNLGRRMDILKTRNQSAISSYLAEEEQSTHYLETPFRNFNLALIDNAAAEYGFLASFFSPGLSLQQVSKNFNYIFEPTFEMAQNLSKTLVADTYDALGILISIRLNQHFAFELQRRKVPAVDGYINGTNMLLWPRLQLVMDRHCESVRQLTSALPAKSSRSAAEVAKMSAAPHVVTQRFAQLLQGILELSLEAGDDEPVAASLTRLRSEVEAFLTKQAASYGRDKRKSERFLYNNYSLVLTIIGDIGGKLAAEQQVHFESLKKVYQEAS